MALIRRATFPRGRRILDPGDSLNQGLGAYYSLGGSTISGTALRDQSDNGNNGTLVGSPTLVSDRVGQALSFNGTNYVSVPNIAALNSASKTLFCICTPQAATAGSFFGNWFSSPNWGIRLIADLTDVIAVQFHAAGADQKLFGSFRYSVGQRTLVAVTYDAGTTITTIYHQDGSTNTFTGAITTSTSPWGIGATSDSGSFGSNFTGSVEVAKYFSRALSAAEINRLFVEPPGNLGWRTPVRTLYLVAPASGLSTITGVLAQTQADETSVIAGSVADRGAVSQTQPDETSVIAGSVADRGAVAQSQADESSVIAGSVADRGAVAQSQADESSVIAGSVADRGAVSQTEAAQTSVIAGSVGNRGTLSQTQADETSVITGLVLATRIGALARTQPDETAVITGSVLGLRIGVLSQTQADQFLHAMAVGPAPPRNIVRVARERRTLIVHPDRRTLDAGERI